MNQGTDAKIRNLQEISYRTTVESLKFLKEIENEISECKDEEETKKLQGIWAEYYSAMQGAIESFENSISALTFMKQCKEDFKKNREVVSGKEEVVEEEKVAEEVVEQQLPVEDVNNASGEVPVMPVVEPQPKPEPVVESEVQPDVSETFVNDDDAEFYAKLEQMGKHVEGVNPPPEDAVAEVVREKPADEPVIPLETVTDDSPKVETTVTEQPVPVPLEADSVIEDLTSEPQSEEVKKDEKLVYHLLDSDSNVTRRAVLVTAKQGENLRRSLGKKEEEYKNRKFLQESTGNAENSPIETPALEPVDEVTEDQMSAMLAQASDYYASGNIEAAEKISDQIGKLHVKTQQRPGVAVAQ